LIILTVVVKIPYHFWHNSHKFMGIVLVLAGFHAIAAGSDLRSFPLLRYWMLVLVVGGIISWLYMLIFYKYTGPRYSVKIKKVDHFKDITEVSFHKPDGFDYQPGQYLFIRFPRFEGYKELFPFSISTDPSQDLVRLSIRRGGDYTGTKVPELRKGDDAIIMGPYGKFGDRYLKHEKDMIWIAGGIGITPFLSLAKHESMFPTGRKNLLIWVVRENKDAFHDSELFIEAKKNKDFEYIHWFSSQRGRISADDIIEILGGIHEVRRRYIFMCGPPKMMESLSRGLSKRGVRYKNIIYEDFNMLD
jgi:predicted ferric reductase